MTEDPDNDQDIRTVEVTATGLLGIKVRPGETVEEATRRELREEMTEERAEAFLDDANISIDDLGAMGDQGEGR